MLKVFVSMREWHRPRPASIAPHKVLAKFRQRHYHVPLWSSRRALFQLYDCRNFLPRQKNLWVTGSNSAGKARLAEPAEPAAGCSASACFR